MAEGGVHLLTLTADAGEVVWVSLYTGLGYVFADNFVAVGNLAGNALGALAAGAIAVLAGRSLFRRNLKPDAMPSDT